jgi:peptidoglycan hydrolase-like protein with peptidoglycan-binding domain
VNKGALARPLFHGWTLRHRVIEAMKQVIAIAVVVLGSTTASYAADLVTSPGQGSAIYTFAQRDTRDPRSTQAPPILSSDVIKHVQQQLKDLGFYEGEIDGKLNPETQEAIHEFQDDNNLAITGSLDAETIDALQKTKQR